MMLRIIAIVSLFVLCSLLESTRACKCITGTPVAQSFTDADTVFIGKAVNVNDVDENKLKRAVTFRVQKSFKGLPRRTVKIHTNSHPAACGLPIKKGETWQIWAHKSNGELSVSSCSPSTKSVKKNVDFLRQRN